MTAAPSGRMRRRGAVLGVWLLAGGVFAGAELMQDRALRSWLRAEPRPSPPAAPSHLTETYCASCHRTLGDFDAMMGGIDGEAAVAGLLEAAAADSAMPPSEWHRRQMVEAIAAWRGADAGR